MLKTNSKYLDTVVLLAVAALLAAVLGPFFLKLSTLPLIAYFVAVVASVGFLLHTRCLYSFVVLLSIFGFSLYSEYLAYRNVGLSAIASYYGVALIFAMVSYLVARSYWLFKLVVHGGVLLALSIPVINALYFWQFKAVFSHDALVAIFQSNLAEGAAFVNAYIGIRTAGYLLAAYGFIVFLLFFNRPPRQPYANKLVLLGLIGAIALIAVFRSPNSYLFFLNGYAEYVGERERFLEMQSQYSFKSQATNGSLPAEDEVYVVVIGESVNKNYMGLYGFKNNTTPNLSTLSNDGSLLFLTDAYSIHTHTLPVLEKALTNSNQYNELAFSKSTPIVTQLKSLGYQTSWLSNQVRYGLFDNYVTLIAEQANEVTFINGFIGGAIKSSKYDGDLLPQVEQWVNKQQQGAVLFVHLMGSHWSYCARLPIDFIQEKQLKVDSERECYPGTILYKDHVLGEIIKLLNTTSKVAALLYFSDHGEEVDQGYGHQSDLFDMAMVEIPVVFWANEKFRARYESRVAAFHKNKDRYFSNDLVYEAILGMLGEKIDDSFNVFSPQYAGDQFERKTLDGRVTIPKASLRE